MHETSFCVHVVGAALAKAERARKTTTNLANMAMGMDNEA
jgi:hypothetical protein